MTKRVRFFSTFLALLIFTAAFSETSMPANLIPLDSPQGTVLFNRNPSSAYFWRLNLQFVTQINPAYCGIASSVMVLNALDIPRPDDPDHPTYKIFTQQNFFNETVERILPSARVRKKGATLQEISQALATFGVKVQAFHANETTLENFRRLAMNTLKDKNAYVMVNFLRTALGEEGMGHWAPLAAYDKETDRFLLFDVARYRYPSVWVKTEDLWKAMNTIDKDANAYRGFIIVQKFPLASGAHSMIVTNNRWASEAAQHILASGGNAVDAAIAAGFVLGLTEPQSSGIGGGGYALVYSAKNNSKTAYDGREIAPHSANPQWFLDKNGRPIDLKTAILSPRSIGLPSEVALFVKLHEAHGKLAWSQLLQPAIRLAEKGFPMSPLLYKDLNTHKTDLETNAAIKKIYFEGDNIKTMGSLIQNLEYAKTLKLIAKNPKNMYHGKLADDLISAINQKSQEIVFNKKDFLNYKVIVYPALCSNFRGQYEICSVPPSTSGGVTVQELMGIYSQKFKGHDINDAKWMYYFLEASKLAFADRNQYIADPHFVKQPVKGLLSQEYWSKRVALMGPSALATPIAPGIPEGADGKYAGDSSPKAPGTTSIAIVDKNGNAISMTLSIESLFGSHVFTHGFFLNNQLTDFSFLPEKDGKLIANRVEAGKRPRSSIAPAMVFKNPGKLFAVSGSPGGSPIICYVAKNLIQMLDMNQSALQAIESPNLCAINEDPIIEKTTLALPQIDALKNMGEKIHREDLLSGTTNILRKPDGGWTGAADPRREGVAIGN